MPPGSGAGGGTGKIHRFNKSLARSLAGDLHRPSRVILRKTTAAFYCLN